MSESLKKIINLKSSILSPHNAVSPLPGQVCKCLALVIRCNFRRLHTIVGTWIENSSTKYFTDFASSSSQTMHCCVQIGVLLSAFLRTANNMGRNSTQVFRRLDDNRQRRWVPDGYLLVYLCRVEDGQIAGYVSGLQNCYKMFSDYITVSIVFESLHLTYREVSIDIQQQQHICPRPV